MDATYALKRLYQHRAWANGNLLKAAKGLSKEQLHASFPIGQGSIWKSLVHMFAAEYVWLEALLGDDGSVAPGDLPGKLPGNQLGEQAIGGLDDLIDRWQQLEQRWDAYLATLTPAVLEEIAYRKVSSSGARFGTQKCDTLLHVCMHAHYTTAQVMNMLRHLGNENLPDTMLISLARHEAKL